MHCRILVLSTFNYNEMTDEIVLARQTMGPSADDFFKVCLAPDKVIWEVALRRSEELEFQLLGLFSCLFSQLRPCREDGEDSIDEGAAGLGNV
jgi:hypothetical protein